VYSRDAESIRFPNGSSGVTLAGNVVYGSVSGASAGYVTGTGLADFENVTWDAVQRNARPSSGSRLLGAADNAYAVAVDINGTPRTAPHVAGAFVAGSATIFRGTPLQSTHAAPAVLRIGFSPVCDMQGRLMPRGSPGRYEQTDWRRLGPITGEGRRDQSVAGSAR